MNSVEELQKSYSQFLADERSDKLKQILREPNIFTILKVSHYEIRHSNFLVWLLDPNQSHELGTLFLERTLRDLSQMKGVNALTIFDIPKLLQNKIQVFREWNNIDILIEFENLIVTIENKIYSAENGNQLKVYKTRIEESFPGHKQLFVYLTPFGNPSSMPGVYQDYSYAKVIANLEAVIRISSRTTSTTTLNYISDYIQNIKRHVMGNSEANEIAKKIYYSHKAFFDFVYQNRPDPVEEFKKLLEQKMKENNYVLHSPHKVFIRFLTQKLAAVIPKNGVKGWSGKEAFLFEINIQFGQKLRVYCTIAPGDEQTRITLKKALDEAFDTELNTKEWYCYYNKNFDINLIDIVSEGPEAIRQSIESIWPSIEEMVTKAESAILNTELATKKPTEHV